MITKNDCMSVLVGLEKENFNIDPYLKMLITSRDIPVEVLKVIEEQRGLEIIAFYEMLRKSYNNKKSPLYKNIITGNFEDENFAITTLACLLVQIILYNNKLADNGLFLKAARAEEISRVLNTFFISGDSELILKLLYAIRSDLIVLEHISGRRKAE